MHFRRHLSDGRCSQWQVSLVPDRVRLPLLLGSIATETLCRTPIINQLEDAFGLIRFIKLRPFYGAAAILGAVNFNTNEDSRLG